MLVDVFLPAGSFGKIMCELNWKPWAIFWFESCIIHKCIPELKSLHIMLLRTAKSHSTLLGWQKRYSKYGTTFNANSFYILAYAWLKRFPSKCNEDKKSLDSYANISRPKSSIGNLLSQNRKPTSSSFSKESSPAANLRFSCPHVKAVSSSKNRSIVQSLTSVPLQKNISSSIRELVQGQIFGGQMRSTSHGFPLLLSSSFLRKECFEKYLFTKLKKR